MSLKEQNYSVLLVSASDRLNAGLSELLPAAKFDPVVTVRSVSAAERAQAERAYDLIIVNAPLPDGDGTRFAVDAVSGKSSVVLLLVKSEQYEELYDRMAAFGVFLLSRPATRASFLLALDWLKSARERLRMTEKKELSFEEKMEEIRLVNRAKWSLINNRGLTEPDAHRYIEKQAMDRCLPKRAIAEEILKNGRRAEKGGESAQ